nr:unnamed protein product [Spirometra erinaceieuropaei]
MINDTPKSQTTLRSDNGSTLSSLRTAQLKNNDQLAGRVEAVRSPPQKKVKGFDIEKTTAWTETSEEIAENMTRHDINPPQKSRKQTLTGPRNVTEENQGINNKTQTVHMQLRSHQKKQLNQRGLMTEKRETEIGRLRSTRRKELPGVEKQSSSEQSTETSSASVDTDAANANILCIDIKDMSSIAPNTKPLAAEKIPGVDGNQNVIMNGSPGTPKSPTSRNQDRPLREQCLVIQGLQEPQADTPKERVLADLGLFQGLLNTLLQPDEEISVLKAFRLGKRSTEPAIPPHPRPLKIVLSCKEHVDLILSRRFWLNIPTKEFFSAGLHTTGADKTPTVSSGAKAATNEWRTRPGYLQQLHNRATVPLHMDTARAYVATAETIGKGGVIAGLPKEKKLKCLYSNAQSLLSKLDELKIYVDQTLPDVISITETWLSASVDDREVALSGYHLFRKDRLGRQGGGVLVYVNYGLFASEKEGQLARTTETIWLTVKTPGSQPLEILTVYRPPRNDPQSDSSLLEELDAISIRPNVMIMGDFNAPNIDWNLTSAPGSEFNFDRRLLNSVQRSHLTQHVLSPTRLREGQLANCLDLVLTKAPESVDVVNCLPPLGKSDHVVLQWEYSLFSVPDQSIVIRRNIWRGDFNQMRLDMRRRDWKAAFTGCVLKDWLELKAILNELITRYCPMSKKKITSRPRWLKGSLKVEVNHFKKAFDSVPHQRLLHKLSRIGVRGKLLKWIENFLVGRSQTVRLGGQHSAEVTVTSGVPQGSVLGPILFLIYIDDCIHGLDCRIAMFADDIKLWTVIRNEDDEANLHANLDRLEQLSGHWLLPFNVTKCNILRNGRISPAHRKKYHLNHTPLSMVEIQKDLGVWITSSLKPSFHSLKAAKSAISSLYLIKRAFAKSDEECFRKVFGMFVRPQLEFATEAWRP